MNDLKQPGVRMLSKQCGAQVIVVDESQVIKSGNRVRYQEEAAVKAVRAQTTIPVPEIYLSSYSASQGSIIMSFLPGQQLQTIWDDLDGKQKESVCRQVWGFISQLRQMEKPQWMLDRYLCSADGSPSGDVLIKDLSDPPSPLRDDDHVRKRICERYHYFGGRRFMGKLFEMLPTSDTSVFSHGDLAPRNILVDQDANITGIVDWELAGWYPDYWEYCNIMKPSKDEDWQQWMRKTAEEIPDLSGIIAARRVLF